MCVDHVRRRALVLADEPLRPAARPADDVLVRDHRRVCRVDDPPVLVGDDPCLLVVGDARDALGGEADRGEHHADVEHLGLARAARGDRCRPAAPRDGSSPAPDPATPPSASARISVGETQEAQVELLRVRPAAAGQRRRGGAARFLAVRAPRSATRPSRGRPGRPPGRPSPARPSSLSSPRRERRLRRAAPPEHVDLAHPARRGAPRARARRCRSSRARRACAAGSGRRRRRRCRCPTTATRRTEKSNLRLAVVGVAVVPADEDRGRRAPRDALARDAEAAVGLVAGRVDDLVVVAAQLLDRHVAPELHVARGSGRWAAPRCSRRPG